MSLLSPAAPSAILLADRLVSHVELFGGALVAAGRASWVSSQVWRVSLRTQFQKNVDRYLEKSTDRLDSHKIGAAMLRAIFVTKPLEPKGVSKRIITLNERLGLYVAIAEFIDCDYFQTRSVSPSTSVRFPFPIPINNGDPYIDQTLKTFMNLNLSNRLEVMLVSNILYLLDMHLRTSLSSAVVAGIAESIEVPDD